MPLPDSSTPLNPTVEEVPDEQGGNNAGNTPNPGMLWPQVRESAVAISRPIISLIKIFTCEYNHMLYFAVLKDWNIR